MKRILSYVIGVVIIGYVLSSFVGIVLNWLPVVAVVLFLTIPFYGMVRHNKPGMLKLPFARLWVYYTTMPLKKRATLMLTSGATLGFCFDELVTQLAISVMSVMVAYAILYVVWTGVSTVVRLKFRAKMPSFHKMMQSAIY